MKKFFLFLLLFLPVCLMGQDCSQCENKLEAGQRYIKVENLYYCSEKCFLETKPACVVCKKKNMSMIRYKEEFYCGQACVEKVLPTCIMCKASVFQKRFLTINDKVFCSKECFHKTIDPCKVCGLKKDSVGKIYKFTFCAECIKIDRCKSCNLPTTEKPINDGRKICSDCKEKSVVTHDRAIELYAEIRRVMTREFGMVFSDDLGFKLVSLDEMKKISNDFDGKERGLYHVNVEKKYEMIGSDKKLHSMKTIRKIYMLDNLHEDVFRKVCAHELAHNWQDIHFTKIKDKKIIEGVAEYFAFMLCKKYDFDYLGELIAKNTDQTYGDGFRFVQSKENGQGFNGVISWLESEFE